MGRRAIPIELIDEVRKRHTTFNKRKLGLLKKAIELSILCDVEISVIMFSKHHGETKMHEYTSSDTKSMLNRAIAFKGPVESFTNASFPHATSNSKSVRCGEKRPREEDLTVNSVTLMRHLLNSEMANRQISDHYNSFSTQKLETISNIFPAMPSRNRNAHTFTHAQQSEEVDLSNSNDGSDSSPESSHKTPATPANARWDSSKHCPNPRLMMTNVHMSETEAPSSSVQGTTLKACLPPLPSPMKQDTYNRKCKPWRRDLNVQIPFNNNRSAAELSGTFVRTPGQPAEGGNYCASFGNNTPIGEIPLDPLATPKTPFGMASPQVMIPGRMVSSDNGTSPIATSFPTAGTL